MDELIVIIVTFNVDNSFKKRFDKIKGKASEIVIVDNGSQKETRNMLKTLENEATIFYLDNNEGIAAALNKGIIYAIKKECKWILTLDHDSIVTDNMIPNMLKCYEEFDDEYKKKVAMLVPIHIEENQWNNNEKDDLKSEFSEVLTEITSGALTKTEIYKNIRMYDEKLFIDLVDHDFCLSLNKSGFKIIRVKSAILIHNLGESVKKNIAGVILTPTNHSPIRRYYMSRNRIYIWEKYKKDFPKWISIDKRRFITENLKIILFEKNKIEKIKYIKRGINDYKKGIFGKYKSNKQSIRVEK